MRVRRIVVCAVACLAVASIKSAAAPAGTAAGGSGATTEPINPHWREALCATCHATQRDGQLDSKRLRETTARANCDRCHSRADLSAARHHPYDVAPSERVATPPARWPLVEGRLSCLTCHDALRQCRLSLKERWRNPQFLRADVEASPVDFCLNCHREALYRTDSPHDQLDEKGRERESVCLNCHQRRPEIGPDGAASSTTLRAAINHLCGNCHGIFPHPLGFPHLEVIDDEMLARMIASEIEDQFVIPLPALQKYVRQEGRLPRSLPVDPATHRATCNTCHNPHEAGVLPPTSPLARGAEGETVRNYRLRMPQEEICLGCHRM